jgi:hypothetical protein
MSEPKEPRGPKLVEGPPSLRALPPPLARLAEFRRFCLWDPDERDEAGKQKKSPRRCSNPALYASTKRPETLGTFAEARAAMALYPTLRVGYVLTQDDLIVFLDFDGCRNPETGEVSPWARRHIDELRTYTEITPSGTGLRMIGTADELLGSIKARIPAELLGSQDDDPGRSAKAAQVEIFHFTTAYVTVSGWRYPGTENWDLGPIGAATKRLHALAPPSAADSRVPNPDKELSDPDLAAVALALPNPVPGIEGGDTWDGNFLRVGLAFWLASAGGDAGLAAFLHWSEKSPKHIESRSLDAWDHWTNSPPDQIAGGSLLMWSHQEAARRQARFLQPSRTTPPGGWPPLNPEQLGRLIAEGASPQETVFTVGPDLMPRLAAGPLPFTPPPSAPPPRATFPLLSPKQLMTLYGEEPEFLIHGFLTVGTTVLVTGVPGAGKSPLVQALVVHMAMGVPWCGMAVRKCRIIYVAGESARQTTINYAGIAAGILEKAMGLPRGSVPLNQALDFVEDNILTIDATVTLETDTPALIEAFSQPFLQGGKWEGETLDVIVYDTLRAMTLGSVTSDEDMAQVQRCVGLVRQAYPRAVVIVLHHAAKADPSGSSGSNRIDAMAETNVSMTMVPAGGTLDSKVLLIRSDQWGPDAEGWYYTLYRLSMGRNKTWEKIPPILVTMAVRGSSVRFSYNGDNPEIDAAAEAALAPAAGVFKDERASRPRPKATVTLAQGAPPPLPGDDGAFASGGQTEVEVEVEVPYRAANHGAEAARALIGLRAAADEYHTIAAALAAFEAARIPDPLVRAALGVGLAGRSAHKTLSRRYAEMEEQGRAVCRDGSRNTLLWRIIKPQAQHVPTEIPSDPEPGA